MIKFAVTDRPLAAHILGALKNNINGYTALEGKAPRSCYMDLYHYQAFLATQFPWGDIPSDSEEEEEEAVKPPRYSYSGVPVALGRVKGCVLSTKEIK